MIEDMTKHETHISTVRRHGAVAERRKHVRTYGWIIYLF